MFYNTAEKTPGLSDRGRRCLVSVEVFISDDSYNKLVELSEALNSCLCIGALLDEIIDSAYKRHGERIKRELRKMSAKSEDEPEEIA